MNAPVLKTGVGAIRPWVRIPPSPPIYRVFSLKPCADRSSKLHFKLHFIRDRLLRQPHVAAALIAVRAEMARRAEYGMDQLIGELNEAADFAVKTENATALVRARELKAKALGLLVDRMDMRIQQIPFKIVINGIDDAPESELKAVANG